jgi:hypothetical protein
VAEEAGPRIPRYVFMMPVITEIKPGLRSKVLDRLQCSGASATNFCGLRAEVTVSAKDQTDARAKAVYQLRLRGLKVARASVVAFASLVHPRCSS